MKNEKTVAIIYNIDPQKNTQRNTQKLQRRLQQAILNMIEDGFSNFILPLNDDPDCQFFNLALNTLLTTRDAHPHTTTTIMLPYKDDGVYVQSPEQRLWHHCKHANKIIYNQQEYTLGRPDNKIQNLLRLSHAVILYHETTTTLPSLSPFRQITTHALRHNLPISHINPIRGLI